MKLSRVRAILAVLASTDPTLFTCNHPRLTHCERDAFQHATGVRLAAHDTLSDVKSREKFTPKGPNDITRDRRGGGRGRCRR